MKRLILGTDDTELLAPYQYPQFKTWTDAMHHNHWRPQETPTGYDVVDLKTVMAEPEREFYLTQFSWLTFMDVNITNPLAALLLISTAPEVSAWIALQIGQEQNHQDSYQYMAEQLGIDQRDLYSRHITRPTLAKKADMARLYTEKIQYFLDLSRAGFSYEHPKKTAIKKLLQGVLFYSQIYEGLWFMGGFAPLFSFCERQFMLKTGVQLTYIWRDEALHVEGWSEWLRLVQQETGVQLTQEDVLLVFDQGIELEYAYAREHFTPTINYNADVHHRWMKYLANLRLNNLGFPARYDNAAAPAWIDRWQTRKEANFFETRPIEYRTGGALEWED